MVALVNVGASLSNINILSGGTSAFTRDVATGGNSFTDDIKRHLGVSGEEAEALKVAFTDGDASADVARVLQMTAQQMAGEFQKSIDFFLASHPDTTHRQDLPVGRIGAGAAAAHGDRAARARAGRDHGAVRRRRRVEHRSRVFARPRAASDGLARPGSPFARGQVSMIKINLLPVKAAKRREQGQKQLLIGGRHFTVTLVGIIVFHGTQVSHLNDLREHNTQLSKDIAKLKAEIGDYDIIKAQRDELIRQRDAIKRLEANRSGPTYMMRELSDILTPGKGPTFNKEQYEEAIKRNPNVAFNPNWDTRRAWLLSYIENNHNVKIHGGAKSDEDVAEFLKRLKVSAFFSDVNWQQTKPEFDTQAQRLVRDVRPHLSGELLMQNFFDRIAALSLAVKLGIAAGIVALLTGGYWYFFYSDMQTEQTQLEQDQARLEKEKHDYEKRKQEYLAFRNEVNALLEEQKDLLRVLPKTDDIEQFIENVQAQIELSGLSKVESVRGPAQPVEMYVKIPIKMSLTGSYHQINRFFKQVGDLKRIVNIEDLSLEPLSLSVAPDQPNLLKANFTATTFMFTDKRRRAQADGHVDHAREVAIERAPSGLGLAACSWPRAAAIATRGRRRRRRTSCRIRRRRRDRRWRRCSRASISRRSRCCKRCASGRCRARTSRSRRRTATRSARS